jgi:putative two-component system response regulator
MKDLEQEIKDAKILIVDDNYVNVVLLQGILHENNYTNIHATTNSLEVRDLYLQHQFDLILLDIRMPNLDGLQVMDQLNEAKGEDYLPVLVLTAQTDEETRSGALARGAKDFLVKPFKHWEVLSRIHNMLETRIYFKRQLQRSLRLDAEVRRQTAKIRETQLEIINRLGRAAELKDNETGRHVIRVSKCCQQLALAIGKDEIYAEMILNASPMHDVGKIGIPDRVLLKPGKLNAEEWKIMQSHVDIGVEIMAGHDSDLLLMAERIAHSHHEKWDGSGYPRGLKGEEIPLEARIAAICDVFDALLSKRPYKAPWSIEDAVNYLKDQAGGHFDPRLVATFEDILPTVIEVQVQYADKD